MEESPRFLVDVMLGSLAKWLRILGYNTAYDNRIEKKEIIERCLLENRIVLTRDTSLIPHRRLRHYLFIQSNHLGEQVREVLNFLGDQVLPGKLLTRCIECNAFLESVSRERVQRQVPSYVYKTHSRFKRCPECQKIYWSGTHREHILNRLERLT